MKKILLLTVLIFGYSIISTFKINRDIEVSVIGEFRKENPTSTELYTPIKYSLFDLSTQYLSTYRGNETQTILADTTLNANTFETGEIIPKNTTINLVDEEVFISSEQSIVVKSTHFEGFTELIITYASSGELVVPISLKEFVDFDQTTRYYIQYQNEEVEVFVDRVEEVNHYSVNLIFDFVDDSQYIFNEQRITIFKESNDNSLGYYTSSHLFTNINVGESCEVLVYNKYLPAEDQYFIITIFIEGESGGLVKISSTEELKLLQIVEVKE
jgi:hypothetical protein